MANKCNFCGKCLAAAEGAKCAKCSSRFHRGCLDISPDTRISAKWVCQDCKNSKNNRHKQCTPVKDCTATLCEQQIGFGDTDTDIVDESETTALLNEIRLLRKEIASTSKEMTFIRGEMARFSTMISDFNNRLSTLDDRVSALESLSENRDTQKGDHINDKIARLRSEFNEREQNHLSNDIEIACLQEKPGENILTIVNLVAKKVGIDLDVQDVVSAERTGLRRLEAEDKGRDRVRPIVVRLARRSVRDDLLRAARVRRHTDSLGITDGEPCRLYINERLTPLNRFLLYKTREEGKKKGWRFIWTKSGRIYIRRDISTPVHRIRTESDISKFFGGSTI